LSHRYRGYNVLYLSYEGVPSTIELSDGTVDLETLADWMKDRFQGYAVHFGSCRMAVDTERLSWFKNTTGAIAVSGYTIQSEWWERFGALELALLGSYLRGKKRLDKVYTGLVKKNGLVIL
jgi:hypothetical protein